MYLPESFDIGMFYVFLKREQLFELFLLISIIHAVFHLRKLQQLFVRQGLHRLYLERERLQILPRVFMDNEALFTGLVGGLEDEVALGILDVGLFQRKTAHIQLQKVKLYHGSLILLNKFDLIATSDTENLSRTTTLATTKDHFATPKDKLWSIDNFNLSRCRCHLSIQAKEFAETGCIGAARTELSLTGITYGKVQLLTWLLTGVANNDKSIFLPWDRLKHT